jgi:polar amino acid transport system substrate-binding protein
VNRRTIFIAIAALTAAATLGAENFKVAVPQLSPASTATYKNLAMAVIEASGNAAEVQVLPFARCVLSVSEKDVGMVSAVVALPDKKKWPALKYDYSTAEAFKIVFVLYCNKAKPIDVAELKKGNPKGYKLETDIAHTDHFGFAISGSSSFEASLKKVDAGDIDGYIFAQPSCDGVVKAAALKNIKRQYFDTFTGMFLIQKGARGGKIDKIISDGMAKIKANGKYQEIMGAYVAGASTYNDWQP